MNVASVRLYIVGIEAKRQGTGRHEGQWDVRTGAHVILNISHIETRIQRIGRH